MLQRKRNKWVLHPCKVRYTNDKNEVESNVTKWALPNKQWWTGTANKHDYITVHEYEEVEVVEEMEKRYEEIKDMPEDFFNIYVEYILTGDTSDDVNLPTNHPFNIVRLKKEDEAQGQDITDAKIEAMEQGQKQSDFDIRLLELEMR